MAPDGAGNSSRETNWKHGNRVASATRIEIFLQRSNGTIMQKSGL